MSIAIPTFAPGAIATYGDLLTEIRDLMDDADYSQQAIDRALRKAEAEFNRSLRTPEMEAQAFVDVTAERSPLPADFLQLRALYQVGTDLRVIGSMSPATADALHGSLSGNPTGYVIEGDLLRVTPVGDTKLQILYYQAIPPLTEAQPSNWLLRQHPDLYIAGVMYHLARRERDSDGMAQAAQEVTTLLDAVRQSSNRARWGAAPITPMGIRQVRGPRI